THRDWASAKQRGRRDSNPLPGNARRAGAPPDPARAMSIYAPAKPGPAHRVLPRGQSGAALRIQLAFRDWVRRLACCRLLVCVRIERVGCLPLVICPWSVVVVKSDCRVASGLIASD